MEQSLPWGAEEGRRKTKKRGFLWVPWQKGKTWYGWVLNGVGRLAVGPVKISGWLH